MSDEMDRIDPDAPVCCRCLRPAGDVPLRAWRTSEGSEEVLDEWVMCWPCVEREAAEGKSLDQIVTDLGEASAARHAPDDEDDILLVGPCCACRRGDVVLRVVVLQDFRVPKSALGKGWGCVVCAIPGNGAIAVLCEPCAAAQAPVVDVCAGYPTEAGRAEAEPLRAFPWSHIRAFHREDGDV